MDRAGSFLRLSLARTGSLPSSDIQEPAHSAENGILVSNSRTPQVAPLKPLKTRVLSTLAVAPIFLGALFWNGGGTLFSGWPFALLVLAMLVLALGEFYAGCRHAGHRPLGPAGLLAGGLSWILALPPVVGEAQELGFAALTAVLIASLIVEALRGTRAPLKNLAPTWLGAVYVAGLMPYAVRLRTGPLATHHPEWSPAAEWMQTVDAGAWAVLFVLLTTAAGDTGAYFVGRAWGRRKLAPEVSPGKTWEGAVGGYVLAITLGTFVGLCIGLPAHVAILLTITLGILGPLGDLSKSAMKRELGIKDFGSLIPGHGGVLDRFDSLLFTAPAAYWILRFWP